MKWRDQRPSKTAITDGKHVGAYSSVKLCFMSVGFCSNGGIFLISMPTSNNRDSRHSLMRQKVGWQ